MCYTDTTDKTASIILGSMIAGVFLEGFIVVIINKMK